MKRRLSVTLVAVGVVTSAGASLVPGNAQAPTSARPDPIRIQPGDLLPGTDAGVLYSTGNTIHVGDRDIRTDLAGPLDVVDRAAHGYVVATRSPDRLWTVHRDGSATLLGRLPGSWADIEVSTDGTRVAVSWFRRGHTHVGIDRTTDGQRIHHARFAGDVDLDGYGKRRVLLSTWSPDRTFWYTPASQHRTVIARQKAFNVDVAHDRISFGVRDPNGVDGLCVRLARLTTPDQTTWRTCEQKPLAWSGRGGRVLTTDLRSDGLGPRTVQMRNVDGALLRIFSSGTFGDLRFAGKNAAMFSVQGARQAALVKCALEGGFAHCTLATGLRPASNLGPNHALGLSMPG